MIKIEKDFDDIPSILKSDNRKEAFDNNITASKYTDDKNLYKVPSIQKKLNEIYHLKCAYCEQKLLDSPKHIEHYRPKDTYFWLAYSWDNLLLSCGSCNSTKGKRFEIVNSQVSYTNEDFLNIHNLSDNYNLIEKPLIINPEKEDVLDKLIFDAEGKINSEDSRVLHTINNACNLNRKELLEKRLLIITNFRSRIQKHYLLFLKHKDITRFKPDIEDFLEECTKENEFYSFRYFIINNIDTFFENESIQKILKGLILKLA